MNCLEISIIRGSDQTDLRPATPLFHVHPRGWPFIAHSSIGFCWVPASISPSWNELFQGMLVQASSCSVGWIKSCHIGYVFSFRKKDSLSVPQPKRMKMKQYNFFNDRSLIVVKSTLTRLNNNLKWQKRRVSIFSWLGTSKKSSNDDKKDHWFGIMIHRCLCSNIFNNELVWWEWRRWKSFYIKKCGGCGIWPSIPNVPWLGSLHRKNFNSVI